MCRPDNNTYIILEQIIPKLGAPSRLGNTIGPGYGSIVRQIYGICVFEPRPNGLTPFEVLWEYFFPGQRINLKPTDRKEAYVEYAGFTDLLTPIQGMNGILPEFLSKTYEFTPPTPYFSGKDPFPQIRLYGNPAISFTAGDGGQDPPTAAAVYIKNTGRLQLFDPKQRQQVLENVKRGIVP